MEEDSLVINLVPAVEQQLKSSETLFVREEYHRLLESGETEEEAKMMIALCLADESNRMYIDQRGFDLKRYEALLKGLPDLPK